MRLTVDSVVDYQYGYLGRIYRTVVKIGSGCILIANDRDEIS